MLFAGSGTLCFVDSIVAKGLLRTAADCDREEKD